MNITYVPIADIYIAVLKNWLLINSRHPNKQSHDQQEPQAKL
uniref:Uncharacterized protein n=2 Tax=Vibrio TaxID=662 RepID=C9E5V8_VIBFL|nr:hypothetical protein ICEVCHMEX1_0064 [Vibrio cholerae Mex1]ACV96508.1 hypothetical protein ICEVFLIND1_0099 [Vibrio fluvialis Ind1]